jgi:predicted TIM-barrel fold metal-dependent hydrolase
MYLNDALPGLDEYVAAAKGFLQDRFLFGTAYPMAPMIEYCQWFTGLPIPAKAMDKVLFENATRLLNL